MTQTTRSVGFSVIVALTYTSAVATELNLTVTSIGSSEVSVLPCGGAVTYEVSGVLTDQSNEGLAGFLLELCFTGGGSPRPMRQWPTPCSTSTAPRA